MDLIRGWRTAWPFSGRYVEALWMLMSSSSAFRRELWRGRPSVSSGSASSRHSARAWNHDGRSDAFDFLEARLKLVMLFGMR